MIKKEMKLLIHYLAEDRRHYTFRNFIKLLDASKYKDDWELIVTTGSKDSEFYKSELTNVNINAKVKEIYDNNKFMNNKNERESRGFSYLNKIFYILNYTKRNNIGYILKCDNDVFIKTQTLDYIYENLSLLENEKNVTISPVITTGIPTTEYFAEEFLEKSAKTELEKMYFNTDFSNIFNDATYASLNEYTINNMIKKDWNKDIFFHYVNKLKTDYKGIHPIRLNAGASSFINEYIIENRERFMKDNILEIIGTDTCYHICPMCFCIKSDIFNKIMNDPVCTENDMYDEAPLSRYCKKNEGRHIFIKNGFAIHMYYNWRSDYLEREKEFCIKFFKD